MPKAAMQPANLQAHAEQALLQEFSPAAVLVNDQGDIVYINGRVGKYLEPASGKANWNIHVMARPPIRAQIAAALRQAVQERGAIELHGLRLDDGVQVALNVTVKAMQEPNALAGLTMVVFRDTIDQPPAKRRRRRSGGAPDARSAQQRRSRRRFRSRCRRRVTPAPE